MMDNVTETEVHDLLRRRLTRIQDVGLLGWNPPNGKTYGLPNILIPKIVDNHRAGSDRIDGCVYYKHLLMLVEIKPASSEMDDDAAKLRRICSLYKLEGVVQILQRQGLCPSPSFRWLVPVLAFGVLDSGLPQDFLCWQAYPKRYQQSTGAGLPKEATDELEELQVSFENIPDSLRT